MLPGVLDTPHNLRIGSVALRSKGDGWLGVSMKSARSTARFMPSMSRPAVSTTINSNPFFSVQAIASPIRVRLARRGGKLQYRGSVLKVGKYLFRDAFIQQLANGRWHVMRRIDGKNRYPIDVVKVPLSGPLTQAFEDARDRIIAAEMPKQLGYALKQQLRLWLTR